MRILPRIVNLNYTSPQSEERWEAIQREDSITKPALEALEKLQKDANAYIPKDGER